MHGIRRCRVEFGQGWAEPDTAASDGGHIIIGEVPKGVTHGVVNKVRYPLEVTFVGINVNVGFLAPFVEGESGWVESFDDIDLELVGGSCGVVRGFAAVEGGCFLFVGRARGKGLEFGDELFDGIFEFVAGLHG